MEPKGASGANERGGATDRGKLAVVTGGGGGLAPAVAQRFAAAGWRLALVTRPGKESAVAELARATGAAMPAGGSPAEVAVYGIELGSAEATHAAFERLEGDLGPVDALLNLAGGFAMGKAVNADPALLERMLDLNLRTAVNATSALLPRMTARGNGFVAVIGANAGVSPAPGMTAYAAAKGALTAYFRSLAAEVGKDGVNVALLLPLTAIDTPGNRAAMPQADPANWIDPAALADALHFLATRAPRGFVHELAVAPR